MKLITGLVIVSLAGCASVSEQQDNHVSQIVADSDVKLEPLADKSTAISPDVLYLLMTAEIAGQRDQYGVALEGYLQAAKLVDDARLSERAAKIGLFLKDADKTDEAVSLWLKQDEKNLTARKIAILSALRAEDEKSAVGHLNRILQDDPAGFESTLMELTKVLEKEDKAEFIYSVLDTVAVQHPDQASVFFVQALLAGQMNLDSIAKERISKALVIQPDWNKALILQAQLAAKSGDFKVARESLEKLLVKTPDNRQVKSMLAQVLIKLEAFEDAKKIYQSLLDVNPEDGSAQFAIALIYLQENELSKAKAYLQALVNKSAWDAKASFYLGRISFKEGQYGEALAWFDKVTQGPYVYDASMAAISVVMNQKQYIDAEGRMLKLSAAFPKRKLSIDMLKAELLTVQKKHQQAFDVLSSALIKFPEHRDLLYTRALVAEKLGKLDVLEADLKQILVKDPLDAGALNALGYTLTDRTERYQEAEVYLSKALELKPDEAVIIDSMGWLRFKQGQIALALSYLRNAYEKQPESEIAAHLAEVLWRIGHQQEAKEIFEDALKKNPEDEYLLRFQQQFLLIKH